ncbi:hypothetical protein OROGR_017574 [Orobanche gracilis]
MQLSTISSHYFYASLTWNHPSLLNHIKVSSHTHTEYTHTHTMQFHIQKNVYIEEEEEQQEVEEEDYIDMELSSKNSSSPQSTREFEFQITSQSPKADDKESDATFPADDLFYKGKLLPLLLPSRRQMLQNLAAAFDFTKMPLDQDHFYHSMPSTNTLNTPRDSCSISPSQSCRVSCDELNPGDCFFEWSTEPSSFVDSSSNDNIINININNNNNNHLSRKKLSWSRKLMKLGQKLKSSRACLKSFFIKSGCSDRSSSKKGNCNSGQNSKDITEEYMKIAKNKKPATTIATIMKSIDYKDGIVEEDNNNNVHRRSFSSAIKRHSPIKCLSSSSSSSSSSLTIHSSGFRELRRSSSATEAEGSIEAAIAHCKKS